MTATNDKKEVSKFAEKLWLIAYKAENALIMRDVIRIHTKDINDAKKHILFWATYKDLLLDAAVLNICKLYRKKKSQEYSLAKLVELAELEIILPTYDVKDSPLERIFRYRDQHLAHKQIVSEKEAEDALFLPSSNEMMAFIQNAKKLCVQAGFKAPRPTRQARNTVKNVLFKMLTSPDVTTSPETFEEWKRFMDKN